MGAIGLIILFIIGMGAVITEMFVPGMIIGICGVICIITSVVLSYHNNHTILGHLLLGCGLFSTPVLLILWYKIFSKMFSIHETEEGFSSSNESLKNLLFAEGITLTPLRPSGIALINGERVDVVTVGDMIEKNKKVTVIEVGGNRVVVKAVRS
ncbi:MAG: hypothetical protein A2W17_04700 [Planctomycetes bacterium RBG_16_41_13]|nr:MAG: hypothetical protein A2W17_04700 [Planctomycetes bacterium RBG_16_41_13]